MQNFFQILGVFFIGWFAGAWVNYFADVLPWKRRLTAPVCVICQASIPWFEYFAWPRRCVQCGAQRHWRVWVIEIFYGLAALGLWSFPHQYLGFWISLGVLVYLGVVVVIDIEYRLILHEVSLTGFVLMGGVGVIWRLLYMVERTQQGLTSWASWWYAIWTTVFGGILGFGLMWVLYLLGDVFLRFVARRRGYETDDVALGFGDVNLAGVLGALLGWPLVVAGLFSGIFIGGVVSLLFMVGMLVIRRYHLFTALPYGPFLVCGAIFVFYFRDLLLSILR